jgi:anti-sigma regulatory factor (Ser/Thr protein kinase)
MDLRTLDLTLPAVAESVTEARSKVCDAVAPGFSNGELETLKLLVSEVVTNAVRHTDSAEPLKLRARWNDEIRIEVCDHGDGFMPTPRVGPLDEPGGFGLFLVGSLADRWGVENDDGTTVWFVIRRRDAPHSLASS